MQIFKEFERHFHANSTVLTEIEESLDKNVPGNILTPKTT